MMTTPGVGAVATATTIITTKAPVSKRPRATNRRVLFVDDEPNVLSALSRTLAETFEVDTASSGMEALALMQAQPRRYAAIISDMRMPQMTGAALLARVRVSEPDTVRILLTGETDVQNAIAAVNEGEIYRFLTKPCPGSLLRKTLEMAVDHHALLSAERELLQGTLRGIVKVMTDILALVSPGVFARATRLKALVTHVARQLKLEDEWIYEIAAVLSQIGCIALPDELVARAFAGQDITDEERATFLTHPETAFRLLADIPRFEKVAAIVRTQQMFNNPDALILEIPDEDVAMGAMLLRAAMEVESRVTAGMTHKAAVADLRTKQNGLPAHVLTALETFRISGDGDAVRGLAIAQLTVGMITDEDVLALSGSVIVPKGTELGSVTLERLRKFALGIGVREPVRVRIVG